MADDLRTTELGPIKILVVDDQAAQLLALRAVLERPDYELVTVSSGEEALLCLLRDEFAVIVLDVAMPGLDGFETATLVRQRMSASVIPIIFVSGVMCDMEHAF